MHSDSAILTGTAHSRVAETAQDHALHRDVEGLSWAVVSDGCSSAGRTDIGSRLWTLAFDQWCLANVKDQPGMASLLEKSPASLLRDLSPSLPLGIHANDMQATLVAVLASPSQAMGLIAGDGALMAVFENKEALLIEHRFSTNLPAYPAYLRSDAVLQQFIEKSRAEGQVLEVHRTRLDAEGVVVSEATEVIAIDEGLRFACQLYDFGMKEPLRALLAITDGLGSRPKVGHLDTAHELLGFANLTGSFLRRRLGKLGAKWAPDRSHPRDDLSVAGVCWPEPQQEG